MFGMGTGVSSHLWSPTNPAAGFRRRLKVTIQNVAFLTERGRGWTSCCCFVATQNTDGSREEKLVAARDRFYKGDVADELEKWYASWVQTGVSQVGPYLPWALQH